MRGARRPAVRRRARRQRAAAASEPSRSRRARHHELTTFGLLRDATSPRCAATSSSCIAHGFLRQTDDAFPVVGLTADGVELLKNAGQPAGARRWRVSGGRVKDRAPKRSRIEAESWQDVDRDLFERLRAVRLEIARARGVPPYVIFHDTTLREMARVKPRSLGELAAIYGMGARKIDALGGVVLDTINAHG